MRLNLRPLVLALGFALCLPAAAQQAYVPQPVSNTVPSTMSSGETHTLNLKAADINVLIQTVSEITGRSFIVDPKVDGKVTVISSKPLSNEEVWNTFTAVLRIQGFAVVQSGDMWKIVPEANAATDGRSAFSDGPDAVVTSVIEVRQVPANELAALLTPLVSATGKISSQGSNLVVTDRASNVDRLARLVARIDTASNSDVEVVALRNANATDVARTLNELQPAAAAGLGSTSAKLVADARSNSVLLSGDRGQRLRLKTLIANLDTPLTEGDSTQVIYVHNAQAKDLVPVLESVAATLTNTALKGEGAKPATIGFHEQTNALIITAAPAVFRELQSVVRQLDVRRAQVLVEAVIAEVSDDLADDLGVQWQATSLHNNADGSLSNGVIGGTNFPGAGGAGGIIGTAIDPTSVGSGLNLGYIGGTVSIPGPDGKPIEILQIGALIRALRSDGRANILSRPSVITLDNEPAEFKVAQEVPFLTGQYASTGTGTATQPSNPFQTIERKDVGLILKVTPHVNEGDAVRLDISQEVSTLSPTQIAGAIDLITNKRSIQTSVQIPDGAMLVLGGLTSDEVSEALSGVPGLSQIPLLGGLFRSRQTTHTKRNLMIFLRPHILRDAASEAALTNDKYNFLRNEQMQMRERMTGRVRGGEQPLLPVDQAESATPTAPEPKP